MNMLTLSARIAALEAQAAPLPTLNAELLELLTRTEALSAQIAHATHARKQLDALTTHIERLLEGGSEVEINGEQSESIGAQSEGAESPPSTPDALIESVPESIKPIDAPPPTPTHERILADLAEHPRSAIRDIASRLGLSGSTVGNTISRHLQERVTVDREEYPYLYSVAQAPAPDPEPLPAVPNPPPAAEPPPSPESTPQPPEAPMPEPAQLNAKPAPSALKSSGRALIAHLLRHGPDTASGTAQALSLRAGPVGSALTRLVQAGHLRYVDFHTPAVYATLGDQRGWTPPAPMPPAAPRPVAVVGPTQAELQTRIRENAALVFGHLREGEALAETQLVARCGLALSHLRAALARLIENGQVARIEGGAIGARAVYRLDRLELPTPSKKGLTDDGQRVEARLLEVAGRGERETAANLAARLGLERSEVDQALAVLHAQGRLGWTRVGHMATFVLRAGEAAA